MSRSRTSGFIERLPGAAHPAVYGIRFDCACGEEHPGLVAHSDLDWAPLGAEAGGFLDLMTSHSGDAGGELLDAAAAHVRAGEWPWMFFCYLEAGPGPCSRRPSSPSRQETAGSGWPFAARSAARCR